MKEIIKKILVYTGLTAFVITWPIADIVIKNDSFRIIEGWSFLAFIIFVLAFAIFPVFIFCYLDYFFEKKYNKRDLFRNIIFLFGATIFWMQLSEYHLVPLIRISGFVKDQTRYKESYLILFVVGMLFLYLVHRLKKFIPEFLKYISLLMLFSIILLFYETVQTNSILHPAVTRQIAFGETGKSGKNIYLLVFDSVSLLELMKDGKIDNNLFPNFSRISKEWTWYRNATTNGASTTPSKSMLVSGQYYSKKITSIGGFNGTMLSGMVPVSKNHLFLDDKIFQNNNASLLFEKINHAVWLNKVIFQSYLDISVAPPIDKYVLAPFSSWKFNWEGEVPKEFVGKENLYYGTKHKEQFSSFVKESATVSEKGNFFFLWSVVTHQPFIYDEKGEILQDDEARSFEVGMTKEEIEKTSENYKKTLQYADLLLGKFIAELENKGLYEDAIIFLLSDHGISKTGTNYDINDQVYRIPFFLKLSGIPSGVNDRDVQTVDVVPTIANAYDLPYNKYDGQSLLDDYKNRDKIIFVLGSTRSWVLPHDYQQ